MKKIKIVGTTVILLTIAIISIIAVYLVSTVDQFTESIEIETKIETVDLEKELDIMLEAKLAVFQNEILDTLAKCETGSVQEPDAAIILDTNGKMSIGRYQWQRESVQHYYQKIYGEEITRARAIKISIDENLSGKLTRDVLFGENDGWKNWYNCSMRNNFSAKIELLNRFK